MRLEKCKIKVNEDVFKSWLSHYLSQCPHFLSMRQEDVRQIGRTMGRAGCQRNWVLSLSVHLTVCNLALCILAPLFPHLSNEKVELDDFQGLFQLEHSTLLYRTFYSIISVLL